MSEIATIQNHAPAHTGLGSLRDQMQFAQALSESDIIPAHFKGKPANCMIAMGVSESLGVSTFNLMQEMSVISGRPAYTAKFMAALTRRAGHRLRQSFDKATGTATVTIYRKDDLDFPHTIEWDEKKARQHGYWGKGHWQKNPELMLKNRALSECVREACPEVLGGISYTPDEIQDFATQRPAQVHEEDAEDRRERERQAHVALISRIRKGLALTGVAEGDREDDFVYAWMIDEGLDYRIENTEDLRPQDAQKLLGYVMSVYQDQQKRKAEQAALQAKSDAISDEDAMEIEVDEEEDAE